MSVIAVFLLVVVTSIVSWSDALLTSSPSANNVLWPSRALSKPFYLQTKFIVERKSNRHSSPLVSLGSKLKRCAHTLHAVATDTDALVIDQSQNISAAIHIDSSETTHPSFAVAAGKGALITSASSEVLIRDAGSINNIQVEQPFSPISELTVSARKDASISSVSSGVVTGDERNIPQKTGKEPVVLPLPIVNHLFGKNRNKGVGAVGKVTSSIRRVVSAEVSRIATESHSDESTQQKATNVDWTSNIQSAVSDMLKEDEEKQRTETFGDSYPQLFPNHGAVLLSGSSSMPNGYLDHEITIRSSVPDSLDDKYIANLRLSVFSNFDEERQNIFRSRSVEVLNRRRRRGAIALVAEMPHADFVKIRSRNEMTTRIASGYRYNAQMYAQDESPDKIIGSVECSHHEFDGTILGNSRPKNSLMYVTEVAVCPEARRCGVGTMLMQGAEEVAALRGIESIYLHVDVNNHAAIAMYEEAGYCKLDKARPIYAQFTCALNLHDGALMGRCHYLMCKHLTEKTTWIDGNGRY